MKNDEDLVNPAALLKRVLYWRMAFFFLVILLAGIAIGASGTFLWLSRQKPKPAPPQVVSVNHLVRRLNAQLKLTPAQAEQVRPVLRQCMGNLEEVRKQARPQINQHLRQMSRGITAVLNEEQQLKWHKIEKRLTSLLQENSVRRATPNRSRPPQGKPSAPAQPPLKLSRPVQEPNSPEG